MGHSNIRLKVRRRKVAILAAKSHQFDVKNHMKKLVQNEDWKMVLYDTWLDRMPRFGSPKVAGKYYTIDKDGHIHFKDDSWEYERHKQPKSLLRYKKRKHTGERWTTNKVGGCMRVYDMKREKRNDFLKLFPNYPYGLPKMKQVEYWEALVQHKLAKWERKNPKPAEEDDMFKEEFVTPWKVARNKAEERIRDFVVSMYDKLLLTGRFKTSESKFSEEKIAEIKDINGEGHKVNELKKDSKLLKKAQEITDKVHAKHSNLVASNLRDHKKQKGRIILPKAA